MAAMAGLLGVQLNKKGVYSLGDAEERLTPAKVRQAWLIVVSAGAVMAICCGLALVVIFRGVSTLAIVFSSTAL